MTEQRVNQKTFHATLEWPKDHINTEGLAVEYVFNNGEGKMGTTFRSEIALAALLLADVVSISDHWWRHDMPEGAKKFIAICVDTSDVFAWGVSSAEEIVIDQIEVVYRYWVKDPTNGIAVWAAIMHKILPQASVEKSIRKAGIWDLDALTAEHGLRANYYDGTNKIVNDLKKETYVAWCASTGRDPIPTDTRVWWHDGWLEFVASNPSWPDEAWRARSAEAQERWMVDNGYRN